MFIEFLAMAIVYIFMLVVLPTILFLVTEFFLVRLFNFSILNELIRLFIEI